MGEQVIHDACELVGRSHNADLGPRRGLQVGYLHTADKYRRLIRRPSQ